LLRASSDVQGKETAERMTDDLKRLIAKRRPRSGKEVIDFRLQRICGIWHRRAIIAETIKCGSL
jgi:hypothetical protein